MRWLDKYGWIVMALAMLMLLAQLVRAFIKFVMV